MRKHSKSFMVCKRSKDFLTVAFVFVILGIIYMIFIPLLVKTGFLPLAYEYENGYHRFYTWSQSWFTGFGPELTNGLGAMENPQTGYLIYGLVYSGAVLAPALVLLGYIRRILKRVTEGQSPFTKDTVKDLRTISVTLLLLAFLQKTVLHTVIAGAIFQEVYFRIPDISWEALIMGMLAWILTEIFRYGAQLQEEVDTTI